ncbi:twin-arginine translocation signal domain-containing protein [Streptomyces sp. NPDC053048]|uniref:twin-arginine translocation signal domain-containing protein n=1 Tax=Streptomyces sp. NPDC053048 TaxID=3365694 RepID=UPI0037D8194F
MAGISRRTVLKGAGVVAGAAAFGGFGGLDGFAAPAEAAGHRLSANGWEMTPAVDGGGPVPGTDLDVALRAGAVTIVLVHVVRRFHYEIAPLGEGQVVGHLAPGRVARTSAESNHASGTAVAIRPDWYPRGGRGGFFPLEMLVVRDVLAECEGVVRWGGDDRTRPYEALFHIDVPPGDPRLDRVAAKIRGWAARPGAGAGAPVDVSAPQRRAAAERLARRQGGREGPGAVEG